MTARASDPTGPGIGEVVAHLRRRGFVVELQNGRVAVSGPQVNDVERSLAWLEAHWRELATFLEVEQSSAVQDVMSVFPGARLREVLPYERPSDC